MKQKLIDYFFRVAKETARLSTCCSKKVGAVLVHDNRILAIGYNGTAPGRRHCNDIFDKNDKNFRQKHHDWSLLNELHAEQNIIAFCARQGIRSENTILFMTLSPCIDCAKLIIATGIREVYYDEVYDLDFNGIKFLKENGIQTYSKR